MGTAPPPTTLRFRLASSTMTVIIDGNSRKIFSNRLSTRFLNSGSEKFVAEEEITYLASVAGIFGFDDAAQTIPAVGSYLGRARHAAAGAAARRGRGGSEFEALARRFAAPSGGRGTAPAGSAVV